MEQIQIPQHWSDHAWKSQKDAEEEAANEGRSLSQRKNNSDCCGKADTIVAAVKLRVVARDEVGSQNPEGTHGGRNVQTSEGNDADVSLELWLLEPACRKRQIQSAT